MNKLEMTISTCKEEISLHYEKQKNLENNRHMNLAAKSYALEKVKAEIFAYQKILKVLEE